MNAGAPPMVVWSLDFELRWGMHDLLGLDRDRYRNNLEGAREAVPEFLQLFTRRGVRATWATVGALHVAVGMNISDALRRRRATSTRSSPSIHVMPILTLTVCFTSRQI